MTPEMLGVTSDLTALVVGEKGLWTVSLIAAALFLRWAAIRSIRTRSTVLTEGQRWWIAASRNLSTIVIAGGLILIWAAEIEAFALSVAAFAVALAIITKELLLCLSGAVLRGSSNAFEIGDWVEIGPHSGEVIDETPISTVLQEYDRETLQLTGRTVTVPNAMLFSAPVVNNHFRKRFIFHNFTVTAEPGGDPVAVRSGIEQALSAAAEDFAEIAIRYAAMIEKRAGVRLPVAAPQVTIGTNEIGRVVYRCELFCPREEIRRLEHIAHEAWIAHRGMRLAGTG